MAMSNEELVRRADIGLADLVSNGGLLQPEQANQFIDFIVDEPTILKQVRTIRMSAPSRKIDRMGFDQRVMRKAIQTQGSRALSAGDRSAVTTSQIELNTKELIAEVHIPYEVLEDNLERGNFEQHTIRALAKRIAQDLEELCLLGDTTNVGDTYLGVTDGYLKKMTSNVVNNANAGVNPDMFVAGMLAMPQRYMRAVGGLKHFVSSAEVIRYRSAVSRRETGYGDSVLTSNGETMVHGIPVEGSPMLAAAAESAFGAADGPALSSGFLTFPQNLLFGIQRNILLELDKDIRTREYIMVVTCRVDFQIDEEEACVKYTNI